MNKKNAEWKLEEMEVTFEDDNTNDNESHSIEEQDVA
jgi:hypothetical protein